MKNTLKIMVLLLVAATMAAMTSCNKQPQVYGKWKITEVSMTIGGESFDYFDEFLNEAVVGHSIEFRKDGTAIADDNEENEESAAVHTPDVRIAHGNTSTGRDDCL